MRNYWRLLRLPYQFQLAPIFGWGFCLAGGHLRDASEVLHFAIIFLCLHIGCFGGLTALNSFYDRDNSPVGGMWKPPPPPRYLWHFAWLVQIAGVLPLLWFIWPVALIYISIVAIALGYSHPRTRWKSKPVSSLIVVALGQGILSFWAGALTSRQSLNDQALPIGCLGVTFLVCAWYPLTQLFQAAEDEQRGDFTVALQLLKNGGRALVFQWAKEFCALGMCFNILAYAAKGMWLHTLVFVVAACASLLYLQLWQMHGNGSPEDDFRRVHFLLRYSALGFGIYLLMQAAT